MRQDLPWGAQRSTGLVDVLGRVLDSGLVIAGDIEISLAEVELPIDTSPRAGAPKRRARARAT